MRKSAIITSLTNGELAVIAVANLGGRLNPIDLEDIAIELLKIAPSRFSLRKYPDQVDIHLVRVSLSHISVEKEPHLLSGSIKTGYMISPDGLEWLESNEKSITSIQINKYRKGSNLHSLDVEINRIKKTKSFKLLKEGDLQNLTINSLYEYLRINEYFSPKKVLSRINIIRNAAANDEDIKTTWRVLETMFEEELKKYE